MTDIITHDAKDTKSDHSCDEHYGEVLYNDGKGGWYCLMCDEGEENEAIEEEE